MRTMVLYSNVFLLCILLQFTTAFSQQFTLLKDINPGSNGTSDLLSINVNGQLFFTATDPLHGTELWKTDGTEEGTVLVKDIYYGTESSSIKCLANVNGVLFFSADDGIHGEELWRSNGTTAGTSMVKDINSGTDKGFSGFASSFLNVNGTFYFAGNDGVNGYELWKSDGTTAGTTMIKDIAPGVYTSGLAIGMPRMSNPQNLTYVNGTIFFTASDEVSGTGYELWKTDGTSAGTTLVLDVNPGVFGSAIHDCINVNGTLFFTAYNNSDVGLWKSDGTPGGTVLLKYLGAGHSFFNWGTVVNNTYYFLGEDGLWKSDGTESGTVQVKLVSNAFGSTTRLTNVNGLLYFVGYDSQHGWELWRSDGSPEGTDMLKDITPGTLSSYFHLLAKIGNKLMFSVSDGDHGYQVWTSDGTEEGTVLLEDIDPGGSSADVTAIVEAGGKAYASISTSQYGNELWVATIQTATPLPLRFMEFKGLIVNRDGWLEWETDNEVNTASFVIERSLDANIYTPIGTVKAENTPGKHSYQFTDKDITEFGGPFVYYRIRQMDTDGKTSYSSIVALSIDSRSNFVRLYSNPVRGRINMSVTVGRRQTIQWQLFDNTGKLIKNGVFNLFEGSTTLFIDIATAKAGIYFLQLKGTTLKQVIRIVNSQ